MVCNIFCVVGGDNVCPWCMFSNKIFVSRITKSMVAFFSWNLMISRLWMLVPRVCTAIGHRGFTRLCLHRGTHYSICFAILICLSLTSAVCWRLHCSADGFYVAAAFVTVFLLTEWLSDWHCWLDGRKGIRSGVSEICSRTCKYTNTDMHAHQLITLVSGAE